MLIKELFEESLKKDYTDLQALLMFLVFEKKVLSMEDDTKELDLYFLEKHHERMNKELASYRKKMSITYGLQVFRITNDTSTTYILAYTEKQAKFIATKNLIKVDSIEMCDLDKLMSYRNKNMTFKTIIEDKKPCVLGGYNH